MSIKPQEIQEITIEGSVESVLFRNEENGYTVLDIAVNDELVTVVGEIGVIDEGEILLLKGSYINHPRFGQQFRAVYCERRMPESSVSIEKYLSSGVIKGIGPTLAKKIVNEFGEKSLEIMEKNPEKLTLIKGISPKKCESISQEYNQLFNVRKIMKYFARYNIQAYYAMRTFRMWGFDALALVEKKPYILCCEGVELDFEKVEVLAADLDIHKNSEQRIRAGIIYILQKNTFEGHTCLPLDKLAPKVQEYLEISETDFYNSYNIEISERNIIEYIKSDRAFVYLVDYFNAESYVSGRLGVLNAFMPKMDFDYERLIDEEERNSGITYEKLQRKAITAALSRGLLIMTGGPGTGKTTTLNAIISIYEKQGLNVLLAAPTGRAAKRMSELTGRDAKTIHRLLEVDFDTYGCLKFKHNETNQLNCNVVVVDEMSMVDVILFESLLKALKLNCRIIMVGDSDQLPSVGAGNVLKSIIDSKRLMVVELKEIFRQAQQSCIVTNAHKIINGEYPDLQRKDNDFFFFERNNPESIIALINDLTKTRLPKAYGYSSIDDIQILSPMRKSVLGVIELNKNLQELLNPPQKELAEVKTFLYTLREGDKIMQIKNNYDIVWKKDGENGTGIFNGDIGRIIEIHKSRGEVIFDFDRRTATYSFEQLEQIELAYAITVHKSQGSEFETVIIPVLGGFDNLYYRNLLYTAVTRAKKMLIIIGSQERIYQMVNNNKKTLRYSCLKHMLEKEITNEQSC